MRKRILPSLIVAMTALTAWADDKTVELKVRHGL
jgi:hypothetical protein